MSNAKDSGRVRVAVRIRPLGQKELDNNDSICIEKIATIPPQLKIGTSDNNSTNFTFDFLFDPTSTQDDIYSTCVKDLVSNCFEGFNATVIAYGQTGSGKTYTMGSAASMKNESNSNNGIILKKKWSFFSVFQSVENEVKKRTLMTNTKNTTVEINIYLSFLEVYVQNLRDLSNVHSSKKISIRDASKGGVTIEGLHEELVHSKHEMSNFLHKCSQHRITGETQMYKLKIQFKYVLCIKHYMNSASSRSHAIFTMKIRQKITTISDEKNEKNSKTQKTQKNTKYILSKFTFVDLAGSERAKRTGSSGIRMYGININKGLLALGNVISALVKKHKTIKNLKNVKNRIKKKIRVKVKKLYIHSKLTRILRDSLGGNSRTLIISCVSPALSNHEESMSTLHYVSIKNESSSEIESKTIAKLKAEINKLRLQLKNDTTATTTTCENPNPNDDISQTSQNNSQNNTQNNQNNMNIQNNNRIFSMTNPNPNSKHSKNCEIKNIIQKYTKVKNELCELSEYNDTITQKLIHMEYCNDLYYAKHPNPNPSNNRIHMEYCNDLYYAKHPNPNPSNNRIHMEYC
eukprot:GSMAST32.ASY1.ANO1.2639.1 assembled CDS